jgi:hypothetical protein
MENTNSAKSRAMNLSYIFEQWPHAYCYSDLASGVSLSCQFFKPSFKMMHGFCSHQHPPSTENLGALNL